MEGLHLEVYSWLLELRNYSAANFIKSCSLEVKYVDIAFGLHDDTEILINDLEIYVPLIKYKALGQYSVETVTIEEAFNELAQSQGVYVRTINWLPRASMRVEMESYDAFISHATEDKDSLVRPLAQELTKQGFMIWYDEFELTVGDSLRQSIDKGLSRSRYGIIILSKAFFAKNWPQYELNGLTALEIEGKKVILPIWHKVNRSEVLKYSPTLADKVAIDSSKQDISAIAKNLAPVISI